MKLIFKRIIPYTVAKYFPILFDCRFILDNVPEFSYILYDGDHPVGCVYGELIGFKFDKKSGMVKHDIIIHKFEVRSGKCGKGYGRAMYELLVEKLNPNEIILNYLDKEALSFWKHMGFKKRRESDELYYKFK